jgi:hypothetical protein
MKAGMVSAPASAQALAGQLETAVVPMNPLTLEKKFTSVGFLS